MIQYLSKFIYSGFYLILMEKLVRVPCPVIMNMFFFFLDHYLGLWFGPWTGYDWVEFDPFKYDIFDKIKTWVN